MLTAFSISTLNAAAERLLRDDRNADVLEKMNEMNKEWQELNEILQQLTIQMEQVRFLLGNSLLLEISQQPLVLGESWR